MAINQDAPIKKYWPINQSGDLNQKVADLLMRTNAKLHTNLINITSKTIPIDIILYKPRVKLFKAIIDEFEKILLSKASIATEAKDISRNKNQFLCNFVEKSAQNFFRQYYVKEYYINNCDYLAYYDTTYNNNLEFLLELLLIFCLWGTSKKTRIIFNPIFGPKIPVIQIEVLLESLIVETSNYIVDGLLKSSLGITFGFQNYLFNENFSSIRKIEQFRNNLMWHKFTDRYIHIPKAVYENRYTIWIISPEGILYKNIQGHRLHEISNLSTAQLTITFILEIQDFVLPKLYSVIKFLSKYFIQTILQPIRGRTKLL